MIWHPGCRLVEQCLASVTRACTIPSVVDIVNTDAVVIHGKYRSCEVNKSVVILIIDRNAYWWVTTKRWFSQHDKKRRPVRSVASDCLTEIYNTVALNMIKKKHKINNKNSFYDWNRNWRWRFISPKSIGIFTVLRCISCPDLVILV